VGKPEGKRQLRRSRSRWEDDIKIDIREIKFGGMTGSIWLQIGTSGRLL
jgi:hypothetical protein